MGIISELNSPVMYLIVGVVVAFVALVCVVFMVRAYKAGIDIGMDKYKLKQTITSSATFAILPSVGILLGVIALAGSLGIPLPWLRLSVIGALHYETQVAEAAAEAVGLPGLSATYMTKEAFVTIALVMSVCIIWGMVFSIFFTKKYTGGSKKEKKDKKKSVFDGFGDKAMTAMFVGLVSCYIGSYIGDFVSSEGLFTFKGDLIPILVAIVSAIIMAIFIYLKEKKNQKWVDSFSIAGSMLVAMASAVLFGMVL
ncbi:MAG: DUF5058 family protein [Erysipelotrichaceae bacterium]|nr:DUF5058 family protein [Erysipelotrichaceae bacterium]